MTIMPIMKIEYITHVLGHLSLRNWNGGFVNRPCWFSALTIYGNAAANPRTGEVEQFIITFRKTIMSKHNVSLYRSIEHGYSAKEHYVPLTDSDRKKLIDMLPFIQSIIAERTDRANGEFVKKQKSIQEWP